LAIGVTQALLHINEHLSTTISFCATIYATRDHVFLVIAGLRFDTGWTGGSRGPRWTTRSRPTTGAVERHPADH
jgi:hypothetical protein